MRLGFLATAALTLGITSALPSFAKADHVRDDHGRQQFERVDRDRHDVDIRRDVRRDVVVDRRPEFVRERVIVRDPVVISSDVDYGVQLCDVPACVTSTMSRQGLGRVETVQFVRRDGQTFYRFRVENGRQGCVDVRVGTDGCLLGIAQAL